MTRFVVILVSMGSRWLRRHPDSARFRLRILKKSTFERIPDSGSVKGILDKKYRRWVKEHGVREFKTERLAWEEAYVWLEELKRERKPVDLIDPDGYQLYVFRMKKDVWSYMKFRKFDGQPDPDQSIDCCYVGCTTSKPEERYRQHRSDTHRARTIWGADYFVSPFESAYSANILNSYENAGFSWKEMKKSEALAGEEMLARWLQQQGIAAYFA